MAIKIHHGPNGSYKTSGAIQDDAVPALKAGRVIITNIRGFTLERCYEVFPDLPDTTDIVNLDLENLDDLEKMRTWMHWAPQGAFIIFDETQLLFPKSWREKDLEKFDFVGGPEAAAEANRPMGWLDAWTRHRHFGWDIVLTTPNISYIRDDIRMTCEMAYRHANLAVIGIKGRYKESQHDAQLNRPPAAGTIIEYKKIKQQTFKLYQSTATGSVRDTFAGKNLFRSPKLLLLLLFLGFLIFSLFTTSGDGLLFGDNTEASSVVTEDSVNDISSTRRQTVENAPRLVGSDGRVRQDPDVRAHVLAQQHPFENLDIYIVGSIMNVRTGIYSYIFSLYDGAGSSFKLNDYQMFTSGYSFSEYSDCSVRIHHSTGYTNYIRCKGESMSVARDSSRSERANAFATVPRFEQEQTRVTVIPQEKNGNFAW